MIVGLSRSQLLEWINTEYDANYEKIEQCGNGAIYCQIFDSVYPGKIPVNRIHLNATKEFQMLANYKLLQMGFNRVGITREVPVEKLMRCKLQDNLEFLQWFCKLCKNVERHGIRNSSGGSIGIIQRRVSSTDAHRKRLSEHKTPQRQSTRVNVRRSVSAPRRQSYTPLRTERKVSSRTNSVSNPVAHLKQEMDDLQGRLDESLETESSLETERNFYFNKLREIEIICQNLTDKMAQNNGEPDITVPDLVKHIQEILYSTAEGFQVPDGDDNEEDEDTEAVGSTQGTESPFSGRSDTDSLPISRTRPIGVGKTIKEDDDSHSSKSVHQTPSTTNTRPESVGSSASLGAHSAITEDESMGEDEGPSISIKDATKATQKVPSRTDLGILDEETF